MEKHPKAGVVAWSLVWVHAHGGLAGARKEKDMSRGYQAFYSPTFTRQSDSGCEASAKSVGPVVIGFGI